jgi:hypothetical protein
MSEIILLQKKKKGKIVQVPCEFVFLTSKDENETCSFYESAIKLIGNPEVFAPDNTLPLDLSGDGIVLGVRAENRLICVRIITFNQDTISEYRKILGEKLPERVACSDACVVDSQYRGNSLQQLTWFMMEPLLHGKYDCIVATVSHKNLVSLKNLLSCGFVIVDRAIMYGGYERFILRKKLSNIQDIKTTDHIEIDLHDGEKMKTMFSEGYVGYKMKHRLIGMHILFGQEVNN